MAQKVVGGVITSWAASGYLEIRPPVGETYSVRAILIESTGTGQFQVYRSNASVVEGNSHAVGQGGQYPITRDAWINAKNNSGATRKGAWSALRFDASDPVQAWVVMTDSGMTFQPPAGKVVRLLGMRGPSGSFQRWFTDGSIDSQLTSQAVDEYSGKVLMTNQHYLKLTGSPTGWRTVYGFIQDEIPVPDVSVFQSLANGATLEFRPPAGKSYMVTHFNCSNAALLPEFTPNGSTWAAVQPPNHATYTRGSVPVWLDNSFWFRYNNNTGATVTIGIIARDVP